MDNVTRLLMQGAAGAAGSVPYVDDVFSTYLYRGTAATQTITNGIDLSGEGGMTWIKNRTLGDSYNFNLYDTERGATKFLVSNNTDNEDTSATRLNQFNNNGFRLGGNTVVNASGKQFLSWSFRKAPGFFDVVKFTGNGTAGRTVAHSLGSVPGMVIIKNLTQDKFWAVGHRSLEWTSGEYLRLNTNNGVASHIVMWNDTAPTSTNVTLGTSSTLNQNGDEYVMYLFAGGASTAATARSVDFNGSSYLDIANHSDFTFGTDDFTIECWYKADDTNLSNDWDYIFAAGWPVQLGHTVDGANTNSRFSFYMSDSSNSGNYIVNNLHTGNGSVYSGQWYHVAVTRSGSTFRIFLNGQLKNTATSSGSAPAPNINPAIGRFSPSAPYYYADGRISNFRYVKGTAVYTESFRPPIEPLTAITNTKLLCCNNSSTTGSTITPGTITANGSPTASTDSPFDDSEGFKFGENEDQPIIKMGTFVGNGNNSGQPIEGPMVDVGWEPSWVLTKATTVGEKWNVFSSMTPNSGGFINFVCPNETDWEGDYNWLKFNSRGFQPKVSHDQVNANGQTYIYVAIRRPDGAVGKPPEVGTDAFAMDVGNGSATIPAMDSGFPVGMGLWRQPASTEGWSCGARLMGTNVVITNTTAAQSNYPSHVWDSNEGILKADYGSNYMAWMWKRGQGCDVVAYKGTGGVGHIPHSLNKIPEMMWLKTRDSANGWVVFHKGLGGGTNPSHYMVQLNSTNSESDTSLPFDDTEPTSTNFTVGWWGNVNSSSDDHIAMLFASVDGISKVGSYTGTGSSGNSVSLGFQPRFLIVKNASWSSGDWFVYDTTRGWVTGNDSTMLINSSAAQVTGSTFDIDPTSTGFTVQSTDAAVNQNGHNFIYYAHA